MFRRLFACLVLLTGLAAVAAPASASPLEEIAFEAGVSVDGVQDGVCVQVVRCDAGAQSRRKSAKSVAPARPDRTVLRPPVLFGIDRAHE